MICMYLPSQGQDGVECRFIVDNVKEKPEKEGKYNNDDERLSRDLKKHNWLINKLKEQLDVPDPVVSEKSSASSDEKDIKKAQRVECRIHSNAMSSVKCENAQTSEEENNEKNPKTFYSHCKIIDYSLEKTTKHEDNPKSPECCTSDDVIYDLSRKKNNYEIHDEMTDFNSQKDNINFTSSDIVYDLSKSKNKSSEYSLQSHNVLHHSTENSINCSSPLMDSHESILDSDSMNDSHNISDLRKIRRIDKHNFSDQPKKIFYSINVDDSNNQQPKKIISNINNGETQCEPSIIKHNLPFVVLPRREKNIRKESPGIKDKKINQTDEVFTVSKEDWTLLNFIKSKGITKDKLWSCIETENSNISKNDDNPSCHSLSDTDSDHENGVINIHILRKLLEQSEKNKNILNKSNNMCNKSQSSSNVYKPIIKDEHNDKKNKKTRVIDILMSESDQRSVNDENLLTTETGMWHAKRKKIYNPSKISTDNNFVYEKDRRIESDIVSVSKGSTFVPQKQEPTGLPVFHYPLTWSRQSVSPYDSRSSLQMPYKYQRDNYVEMENLNSKSNAFYDHRMLEYTQNSQRYQHCTPRRFSPYTKQQIHYLELPRFEPKVHYGPVQRNNQYINIRGTESPHRPRAVHPMWRSDNRIHMNPQKIPYIRSMRQEEDFLRESKLRESDIQKHEWDSETINYPNTDWRK